MRVPLSWLREYVPIEVPLDELTEKLSVAAAEVEGIERIGVPDANGNLERFRVGRVLEAEKHPNADRLQLCRVDVGEGEPRQIVCGAWNFGPGATVAVALPGAVLPGGLELERRKVRDEVSDGMILAEDEVELGPDHTGIMVLAEGPEPGTPLAEVLPLADDVLLLEPTGNRPDLLAVYGVAREVAALFDAPLTDMPGGQTPGHVPERQVEVEVDDFEGCPRYIGRLFENVRIEPSPLWLKSRLLAAGMRPISNVVDITNYVMLALGNPLHAFDFETLGGGKIVVRRARKNETLRTLDGVERRLDPHDLLIADAERGIALAGIMGGEETEIGESTTKVLLEAANFEPFTIFKTSERLRLRTEGSNRWEKGVDPYLAAPSAELATKLLLDLAGAEWTAHTDAHAELPERPVVTYRPERADAVIGLETPADDQYALLGRLGFDRDDGSVVVPTWRARDVTREIDVVEEIARFRLEDVPFTLPVRRAMFGALTREQELRRRVEDALVGLGFAETYTPSLVADDETAWKLPEPIAVELTALRTSLLPSLVEAARRNVDAGAERIALFEIARVYLSNGELPNERLHVAAIAEGGFARAKGVVEALYEALKAEPRFERAEHQLLHPGKTARTSAGVLGELNPRVLAGEWGALELDLESLFAESREPVSYEDVITYPAVRQDLAFVVPEDVEAGALVDAAREAAGPELREVDIFDVYRGEQVGQGKKSIAFSVAFQSPEQTLSDEDAAALRQKIADALAERFGAVLRSA
ncbi:MAG: phenylalanine--tRNA ligase subunit beta [Actinobacteria bacterium]|nr:MAG: phenylalanine--tRNA ligase subunit beta [Actinomycetota bacterium]